MLKERNTMLKKYLLYVFCVFAFISCGVYNPISYGIFKNVPVDNVEVIKNKDYICFMKKDMFLALFKYKNSDDLKNYLGDKTLLLKSKLSTFKVLDLNEDIFIARENYNDGPSPVVIVDLANSKNLLEGMYFSTADKDKPEQKFEILKLIGDRIKKEQEVLIKKPIKNMEDLATSLFKSGLGFEFYEKYRFDYETKKIINENEVVPIVQKKFTWM
jgi:hypothetical protein